MLIRNRYPLQPAFRDNNAAGVPIVDTSEDVGARLAYVSGGPARAASGAVTVGHMRPITKTGIPYNFAPLTRGKTTPLTINGRPGFAPKEK